MGDLQTEVSVRSIFVLPIDVVFSFLNYIVNICTFRFDEMVHWMDHVDNILRTILREVNTLEEFEKEKTIFQVRASIVSLDRSSLSHVVRIFKHT